MLQAKGFSTPGSTKKIEILRSEAGFVFFLSLWLFRPASFPVIVMMRGWSTGTKAVSGNREHPSAHTYTCTVLTLTRV